MTLELLDEKGFIFLDSNSRPRLCRMRGKQPWLFYWHRDGHWVSQMALSQADVWSFPRNLTEEQQQIYRDKHQEWSDEMMPSKDSTSGN